MHGIMARAPCLKRGKPAIQSSFSEPVAGLAHSWLSRMESVSVKHALKRHLPTLARFLANLRSGRFEIFPPRITYANGPLHAKIKTLFNHENGFYFEVGANDGLKQSNTAYLEKHRGWRGVLVEPVPILFAECVKNRSRSMVVNAALVSSEFSEPYVDVYYGDLMSITGGNTAGALDREAHLETARQFLSTDEKLSGHRFIAAAMTVSKVLDDHGVNRIDFFSLDVEGYELEVLKGMDFARHRPRYFLIEVRDPGAVTAYLAERGYHHADQWSHHDQLYVDGTATKKQAYGSS